MRWRPGVNLVRLCAGLVVCAVGGAFHPALLWGVWLLVPAALCGGAVDVVQLRRAFATIRVSRRLPPVVARDAPFDVVLALSNAGKRVLRGDVREVVPVAATDPVWTYAVQLDAGGSPAEVRRMFRIPRRGAFEFGPVWLRLRGPCGVLEAQRAIPVTSRIKVWPEGFASDEGLDKDEADRVLLLDQLMRSRAHGVGTEFESLAEFREGDDPRRMDWRATARLQRPIVRRYQVERHRDVMLLLDCGRLMGADAERGSKLDCAVDAALMLGRVALSGGDRCGLGIYDDRVLGYLPPVSGLASLRILAESLFDLQSRWRESDFSEMFAALQARQPKRSLVVVLSDVVDAETSGRFRASLARLARRHVVLLAALRTPLLRRWQHAPVQSIDDGARHAVALRLLREREKALHSLRHGNVHVLDVEPAKLTVPLINRFLQLRVQNLL